LYFENIATLTLSSPFLYQSEPNSTGNVLRKCLIVRYGEIALKGKNRERFEKTLERNMRKSLEIRGIESKFKRIRGRILAYTSSEEAEKVISKIPGVVSVSLAEEMSYDELFQFLANKLSGMGKKRFKVDTKRVDKSFPKTSIEINREVGSYLKEKLNWEVDLENPQVTVNLEVINGRVYYFTEKVRGPGGLPVGTQGRVVSLVSTGIDSPVATYLMMKRGCEPILLHFDRGTEREFRRIVDLLSEYHYDIEYLVEEQKEFPKYVKKLDEIGKREWTCVLCKYMMLKRAEEIAKEKKALGIVTGDNLGQVASQTLENIYLVSKATSHPVYRPLIGMDKVEIENLAKRIGTYEHFTKDKCEFRPRRVVTRGREEDFSSILAELGMLE